nr:MAG TPA: hypothetical protein [Caudoviricetes sp.]
MRNLFILEFTCSTFLNILKPLAFKAFATTM